MTNRLIWLAALVVFLLVLAAFVGEDALDVLQALLAMEPGP